MGGTLKLCKLTVFFHQCGLAALPSVQWLLLHRYHHFNLVLCCHLLGQWGPCQVGLLSCLHLSVSTSWLLCRDVLASPRCPFVPAALVPGAGHSWTQPSRCVWAPTRPQASGTYPSQLSPPCMWLLTLADRQPAAQLPSRPSAAPAPGIHTPGP